MATYYIATTGNDTTGDGSIGAPWKSLSKASSVAVANDTVYLRGGTWTSSWGWLSTVWHTINSGSAGNPITWCAYQSEIVVIQPGASNIALMIAADKDYHTWQNIIFDGTGTNSDYNLIDLSSTSDHWTFINCTFRNKNQVGCSGVLDEGGGYTTYTNCKAYNNGSTTGHGMYIMSNNCVIDGGEYYSNASGGIQVQGWPVGGASNTIKNVWSHDNGKWGIVLATNVTGTLIYNNLISNQTNQPAIEVYGDNADANLIYSNTIYNSVTAIGIASAGCDSNELKNNLIRTCTTPISDSGTGTITANNFLNTSDPLFVNPATNDFRLQSGSPCQNQGATLGAPYNVDRDGRSRPQGAAYDQGCYETPEASGGGGGVSQLTYDTTTTYTGTTTQHTWSHTTTSGTNRILIVAVAIDDRVSEVSSVTYGGAALARLGRRQVGGAGNFSVEQWYRVAPASGANNVVVTLTGAETVWAASVTYYGCHQTIPVGTTVTADNGAGYESPITVTASSASGEIVIDAVLLSGTDAPTVGAGQTQRANIATTSFGLVSTEPGVASVVMSWTYANSHYWATVATPLKPAASASAVIQASHFHVW